jgi:sucrose-phosphate synthase
MAQQPERIAGHEEVSTENGLYLVLISIHGLIRGKDMELGRDADTGGQTKYVVELARALGEQPGVRKVDLLTRRIDDANVDRDYALPREALSERVHIVRIDCGDPGYIRKEELWDSLDNFADNVLSYINAQPCLPDIIHSHYADAGYVGTRLSNQLGVPLLFTGHSLGRSKRRRLLASGLKGADIEQRYNMTRRIEAEEMTLGVAERVVTSTHQEVEDQYGLYDYYQPDQMRVIPPGTDLKEFFPATGEEAQTAIAGELARFLRHPDKPIILALSRPDQRKNIATLIEAYGESPELQRSANLVVVAGNRDDIRDMEAGAQEVLREILLVVDQHDLYGKIAYPKHHQAEDVSVLYRLAALSRGVFVNPALTEPFGLTLIEAAACGLPLVATEDGGPQDIIGNCDNGYLVDPLDKPQIARTLLRVLTQNDDWQRLSENGIRGVRRHYSWKAHADKYLALLHPIIARTEPSPRMCLKRRPLLYHDRAIFSDLDQNLVGDPRSLEQFIKLLRSNRKCVSFGIATGRRLDSALTLLKRNKIPQPDVLITSLGTEIHYAPNLTRDTAWRNHIDHLWNPKTIKRLLAELPGLQLQPKSEQSSFKLSYYIDPQIAPDRNEITRHLHQQEQTANVIFSFGQYLDIIPVRASKGMALRWFTEQWDIPLSHILAAGGSGADEDMMRGNTLAAVVANRHEEELSELADIETIYFSKSSYAAGIMEAIDHYDFLDTCEVPD